MLSKYLWCIVVQLLLYFFYFRWLVSLYNLSYQRSVKCKRAGGSFWPPLWVLCDGRDRDHIAYMSASFVHPTENRNAELVAAGHIISCRGWISFTDWLHTHEWSSSTTWISWLKRSSLSQSYALFVLFGSCRINPPCYVAECFKRQLSARVGVARLLLGFYWKTGSAGL